MKKENKNIKLVFSGKYKSSIYFTNQQNLSEDEQFIKFYDQKTDSYITYNKSELLKKIELNEGGENGLRL